MSNRDRIIQKIYEALEEVNFQIAEDKIIAKSGDSPLFGENGKLDSLGLVHLLVSIEERIQDEFKLSLTLADERALSMGNSPFRTIDTLADYILLLINENADK